MFLWESGFFRLVFKLVDCSCMDSINPDIQWPYNEKPGPPQLNNSVHAQGPLVCSLTSYFLKILGKSGFM